MTKQTKKENLLYIIFKNFRCSFAQDNWEKSFPGHGRSFRQFCTKLSAVSKVIVAELETSFSQKKFRVNLLVLIFTKFLLKIKLNNL